MRAGRGESLRDHDRGGISWTQSRVRLAGGAPVSATAEAAPLKRTPLHDLHCALGARMVGFAGYEMPVQYPAGIIAEHLHTRAKAGLFDVSHIGQIMVHGGSAAGALEGLVPGDLQSLSPPSMRFKLLL